MSKPRPAPLSVDLTVAGQMVGLSKDTLERHIHAGRLKAKKTASTGGKTLVRVRDLEAWFDGLVDA